MKWLKKLKHLATPLQTTNDIPEEEKFHCGWGEGFSTTYDKAELDKLALTSTLRGQTKVSL